MKNCPKCHDRHGNPTEMRIVNEVSQPSNLIRNTDTTVFLSGWKCWQCGTWIPVDVEGMPLPPAYVRAGTPIKEFCAHGHKRTPDNVSTNGSCKTCAKIRYRKRNETPEFKAYQKAYRGKSAPEPRGITFGSHA